MAENLKYNIREELMKADDRLHGSLSMLGMTMLTQPAYINSMRSVMFTSHLKQFVNLINPDFPGVFTNGENPAGIHSSGYKQAKHKTRVIKKIWKYDDILEKPTVCKVFVFDEITRKYDVWTRQETENLTEVFGFDYDNDVIDRLEENDIIDEGEVVYKSKSYDEVMNYGYGKNVTVMYTTEPFTSEDACVVAESLCDEMTSIEVNKVPIGLNQNDFLLNMYGDDDKYKAFPDIGEWSDGEVAVRRTLFKNQLLVDFKDKSLHQISDADTCFYKTGKVIDIDVYCNNDEMEDNPFNRQILKYLGSQTRYYQKICKICEQIVASGCEYSSNIDYLYKRAKEFLNPNSKWKDDTVFSGVLLEITVKNYVPLQVGQKLTGRYGNKYYDDNGNKVTVKLLLNILAIINRTTAFPIFEISINFICNKFRAKMKNMTDYKEKEKMLFDLVNMLNETQAAEMHATYKKLSKAEKIEYIDAAVNERIYIHQLPMWETKPIFYRLLEIYAKYDFLDPYKVYINKWGREIECLNPGYIGEMYILRYLRIQNHVNCWKNSKSQSAA